MVGTLPVKRYLRASACWMAFAVIPWSCQARICSQKGAALDTDRLIGARAQHLCQLPILGQGGLGVKPAPLQGLSAHPGYGLATHPLSAGHITIRLAPSQALNHLPDLVPREPPVAHRVSSRKNLERVTHQGVRTGNRRPDVASLGREWTGAIRPRTKWLHGGAS